MAAFSKLKTGLLMDISTWRPVQMSIRIPFNASIRFVHVLADLFSGRWIRKILQLKFIDSEPSTRYDLSFSSSRSPSWAASLSSVAGGFRASSTHLFSAQTCVS